MTDSILAGVQDGIGLITFNRPGKHNALSAEMWTGVEELLETWADDNSVRAVILTGAGEKAFISGADIGEFESRQNSTGAEEEYKRLSGDGKSKLSAFPKPTLAAIRGYCLGSGLAVAIHADIRIASEDAQFGIPAGKMGLAYGFPSIKRLVELVGPAHAGMILYTGERIASTEALSMGLVNRIAPNENVLAVAMEMARRIAENAPLSVRASKITIEQILRDPAARDLEAVIQAGMACLNSEDHREGRDAFLRKRKPRFRGR
jgi:enoyl-CoA hydratase